MDALEHESEAGEDGLDVLRVGGIQRLGERMHDLNQMRVELLPQVAGQARQQGAGHVDGVAGHIVLAELLGENVDHVLCCGVIPARFCWSYCVARRYGGRRDGAHLLAVKEDGQRVR